MMVCKLYVKHGAATRSRDYAVSLKLTKYVTCYKIFTYLHPLKNHVYVFQPSLGTVINSLFWVGFGLGRLGGVIFLRYISPRNVILIDLVGTILCMVVVSIFGESTAAVTWAVTFLYGFFQATIYPAGVSWASKYTNMSGNYIFIFSAGQALGTMTLVPAGGILFDIEPFYVMYLVLGCSVCNAITFGLMMFEGRRLNRKHKLSEKQGMDFENISATVF